MAEGKIRMAFETVDRANFIPSEVKGLAYENRPLPIGFGQTISQPYTVAFMLNLLNVKEGENILEIGAGSGWQTALLAFLVGIRGKVTSIEKINQLVEYARSNLARFINLQSIFTVLHGDGKEGYYKNSPYDKIIAAASATDIPLAWKDQLKVGGSIVAPIGQSIIKLIRQSKTRFNEEVYPGFVFVPLI